MKTHNELVKEFKELHHPPQFTTEYNKALSQWVEFEKEKFCSDAPKLYVAFRFYMGGHGIAEVVEIGNNLLWMTEYDKACRNLGTIELNKESTLSFDETVYGQYITLISKEEYDLIRLTRVEIERSPEPNGAMGDVAGSDKRLGVPDAKSDEANDLIHGKENW